MTGGPGCGLCGEPSSWAGFGVASAFPGAKDNRWRRGHSVPPVTWRSPSPFT